MMIQKQSALVSRLTSYAAYHRDRRNILTHFFGVPLIVLAVAILLAKPVFLQLGEPGTWIANWLSITPACLLAVITGLYYLKLDLRFGLVMALFLGLCLAIAHRLAMLDNNIWLGWGVGLFVFGWILQFIGHYYEGRKPAFVDDLMGLIIGPLFVTAELAFGLGLRRDLQHEVEAQVGPTRIRSNSMVA